MTIDEQREYDAKLCEELAEAAPYNTDPRQRVALFIAASVIRRGRVLTMREQLNNLCDAMHFADASKEEHDAVERFRAQITKDAGGLN